MSFDSEYNSLRKKRLEEEENKKQQNTNKQKSADDQAIADEYTKLLVKRKQEEAIPKKQSPYVPEPERTWFQAGAFEDGYDFGDITKMTTGTFTDGVFGLVNGVGNLAEGVIDLATYLGGGIAELFVDDGYETAKEMAQYEIFNNLFDSAREGLSVEENSFFGDKTDEAHEVVGGVIGTILSAGIGGAAGLGAKGASAVAAGVNFASSTGSGLNEAYEAGASDADAWKYGATKGAIDAGTELIFGGLGKGTGALGLSKSAIPLDDMLAKKLTSNISNSLAKNAVQYGVKATAEGVEELAAGYLTAHAQKGTFRSEEEFEKILDDQDLIDQFVMGALASGVVSSVGLTSSVKSGRDYITGLTANEQTVVDAEITNRIAEAEKDGNTLTNKEKGKIESEVIEDLKKGYISTNTIESALGGDTFKSYQDTVTNEESILKEYEELGKKQNATLAEQARYAELQEMVKDIKANSKSAQLQAQLSEEVQKSLTRDNNGKVQTDDFLLESYNERARRGQTFEADVSKYDAKQQATIQKAIDSGILNNTRRTHDFVDMVAKISAEKGVLFDFTNNAKLKESSFAVDGKFVNGYVTKDGVTLNIESSKSLNSVVGHEITHVLEGTELYTELQNTLKEYATSKKEYTKRLDALKKLYEGVEGADIEAELTADLVGDYLFTDSDFIKHLSTKNRNIFQKIYDEIKYLCKIATAGSKEARQLEKVKRAFDKAYRESGKKTDKTSYSLSMVEDVQPTTEGWKRTLTTEEAKARFPKLWDVTADESEVRNPTQISSTVKSYRKVYDYLKNEGFDGTILDASSGLGYGTRAGIEEYGFDVEDIEPYPDKSYNPKYRDYSSLDKKYDVVISNAVLNVLPQDQRDALVVKMGEMLNDGGRIFINVRGKDVDTLASNKNNTNISPMEWFVDSTGSYQKGFTKSELVAYLKDALGDGFTVKPTNLFGAVSAVVTKDGGVKYSLSAEQQEYFKDSKVRDENGNLKVMYHGTSKGGFTVFDTYGSNYGLFGQGSYFTDNKSIAESYTNKGKGNNKQVYESYLNITNPIDMDAQANPEEWQKAFPDADFPESGTNEQFYRAVEEFYADQMMSKWEVAEEIQAGIQSSMGYDGITHIGGGRFNKADDTRHQVYIAFEPEQIKNIDNLKPTSDPDIRYSLSEDSEGNALTDGQKEYFKDSKALDNNGNLLKVYHTTNNDFTVFDKARKGETTEDANTYLGFFFADDSEYMANFPEFKNGKTEAYYLNMTNPIDMTNISREAFLDVVEVLGGDVQEAADIYDEEGGGQLGHLLDAMTGDFYYNDFINELKPHYNELMSKGYDGVINYMDELFGAKEYVVLDSNQAKLTSNANPSSDPDIRYSLSDGEKSIDKYTQKQYNNFGWAIASEAISKNELDDMYSKIHVKGSLKKFPQTSNGEAIIEVNNKPNTTLDVDNVFVFVTGTKNNPQISRVARFQAETETEMEIIKGDLYEGRTFSNPYYSFLKEYGIAREYSKKGSLDYLGYKEKVWRGSIGAESNGIDGNGRFQQNGSGTLAETQSNEIAPIKQASSTDGVFFDANKPKYSLIGETPIAEYDPNIEGDRQKVVNSFEEYKFSLSNIGETPKTYGNLNFYGKDMMLETPIDIAPMQENVAADDIAPTAAYEAIKPKPEKLDKLEEQWAKNKMARADKVKGDTEQSQIAQVLDTEPTTETERNQRKWAIFKANVLDKGAVFEDLSLKTKNRNLMGKWNYTLYSEARAQRLMGEGAEGVKSLNAIREEVGNTKLTKQFYEYMYHKHNVDRMRLEERYEGAKNKPVFGYDVTAEASQEIVNQYEFAQPEFKRYAQDVYDYMNHLRKLMVDNGVISQETADVWAEMYPHYVPIRRKGDTGLNINVPLDTGRTGVNAPVKKATGGNRDILPLFDTIAQRTAQTYKAIAKNSFGIELKNTLGSTVENTATNLDEVFDSIDTQDELLKEGKNGQNPTFTVFENGERVTFEITKDMYDAMKPLSDSSFMSKTIKPLNVASNIHRGLLTAYNPVFMLTNAVKDIQDVLMNSQHAAKTYAKIPEAYAQMFTKGYWYKEYMENGGDQNTYFDNETNTFKTENKGIAKMLDLPPFSTISKINNFIEMTPRLAEYIASREAGASVEVAMLDAARVTTNFKAGGDFTKFLNRNGATFLNASVQGAMQQVRNVREAKANGLKGWVGLATKFAVAGLPAILLNNLVWEDDEEYEELSDYVKDNYYIVAKYGDGSFVRIPKGRTVAVIQEAIEQVGNALTGNDEADFANVIELAVSNLAPNNPIDNNILAPIIQVANNETWYGEDLVPTRLQDLPASEQYDESTDALSKWLGETFNYSPYKINYLLNQYSGGLGDVLLPMMTPEAESGDNSLLGNITAPLKDKFTTDSVMNNQNVSDFYETVDELTVNANGSNATDEDILKSKYINSVSADLGELYKQKREIQNSDLADDEKYAKVRDIQAQINALAKNSLNTYGNVSINGEYATIGDRHFKKNEDGEWQKVTDKQLEKQEEVTSGLGIDPSEYWSNKTEYDFAYEYPEKYAVAKSVGGYDAYKTYSSELYDIKADKDENGKSINGSRKEKVIEYINNLDADYGEKLILFKSEYNADDTYNYEIIDYLNSREDISYKEMETILKELGFMVKADGTIEW